MSDDTERFVTTSIVVVAPFLFAVAFEWAAGLVWP